MHEGHDLIVFVLFLAMPVASGAAVALFFGKYRLHQRPRTWPRLLAGNLLLLLFLATTALLAGEIYYRYASDTTEAFGLTKTTSRWLQRHIRLNEAGFRDSVSYALRRTGPRRITFVGDSFTVGHGIAGVEERFVNRVRAALPGVEVHAVAQMGWDTAHELSYLRRLPRDGYELDLVVLVYNLNDIADIVPEWRSIVDRIYAAPQPGYFVRHSWLLNTLYYRSFGSRDPDVASYYQFVLSNYDGRVWQEQRARLESVRDFVAAAGSKLAVVTFPFLHSLGPDYPCRDIHRRLDACWAELGVPHLDLLGALETRRAEGLVVNRFDAHPGERAHAIAAEAIVPFLEVLLK